MKLHHFEIKVYYAGGSDTFRISAHTPDPAQWIVEKQAYITYNLVNSDKAVIRGIDGKIVYINVKNLSLVEISIKEVT